jgi:hypothetical protein
MTHRPVETQAKNFREELRRSFFVLCRNYRVIELYRHHSSLDRRDLPAAISTVPGEILALEILFEKAA